MSVKKEYCCLLPPRGNGDRFHTLSVLNKVHRLNVLRIDRGTRGKKWPDGDNSYIEK